MLEPFNSALEVGVRSVAILTSVFPKPLDLQHLVYFDYFTLHTADLDGPPSLHTALPMRSGELAVRGQILERGLLLMISRGLIELVVSKQGFAYVASESANAFLVRLSSQYILNLQHRATWVAKTFSNSKLEELQQIEKKFLRQWSAHFQRITSAEMNQL